ncbi:MAG: phage holin family protein [Leeuwenhoekiella sp.]
MSFSKITDNIHELTTNLQDYIDSSTEYYKLDLFKKMMKGAVSLVKLLVIGSIFLVFLLFISVAVAISIGESMEHVSTGYYIVSGFYLVVFILFVIFGGPFITKQLLKKYSAIFFNESTQDEVLDEELKNLTD